MTSTQQSGAEVAQESYKFLVAGAIPASAIAVKVQLVVTGQDPSVKQFREVIPKDTEM